MGVETMRIGAVKDGIGCSNQNIQHHHHHAQQQRDEDQEATCMNVKHGYI